MDSLFSKAVCNYLIEEFDNLYMSSETYGKSQDEIEEAQKQIDVKIKLRKEMTAEQTGMIKNSAELGDVYNTEGIEDINSISMRLYQVLVQPRFYFALGKQY